MPETGHGALEEAIELVPELRVGFGDDAERLAQQLRLLKGADAEAADLPKAQSHKDVLQWAESLSHAFMKAWTQRMPVLEFVEKACSCGEGLMNYRQYNLAFAEVYNRFADRLMHLKSKLELPEAPRARSVAAIARYQLGRCMALYQQTIHRDENAKRPDTVETMRDVLRDILSALKFLNQWEVGVREELYWVIYNSNVLAFRVARWLRVHGFGGTCVGPLGWLAKTVHTCLPMMAVHMVPLRTRFLAELVSCAEASFQLGEAARLCDVALEQLEKDQKLELLLQPVPEETVKVFDGAISRFRMLKIKYDFWTDKVADAKQVVTLAEDLGPKSCWVLPCLLEVLQLQHGLVQYFGAPGPAASEIEAFAPVVAAAAGGKKPPQAAPAGKDKDKEAAAAAAAAAAAGAGQAAGDPASAKMPLAKVVAKQRDLLEAIFERVRPLAEKAEGAAKFLEEFTAKRLAFEAEEERRARSGEQEAATAETGKVTAPERPNRAMLADMGFVAGSPNHALEDLLPLAMHALLARELLRHELQGGLQGKFKLVERWLAVRLRYRHFFCPPLVDLDVLVSPQRSRDKVDCPDKYEFITEDLNVNSQRNRQLEADGMGDGTLDGLGSGTRGKGKHVYIIGQRYDAWESWVPDVPVPIRRLCNLRLAFASKPPTGGRAGIGFFDARPVTSDGKDCVPWSAPYTSASAWDHSGFDHTEESAQFRDALLSDLVQKGHIKQMCRALPIEAHSGAKVPAETIPYLVYSTYDEGTLWTCDAEVHKPHNTSGQPTLLPAQADVVADAGKPSDPDSESLLPPWCPLLDNASVATHAILDLAIFGTKQVHASAPAPRFNALIRADLRQTPSELLGKPFQSYIFACAAVNAPSTVFVARQVRVLRAFFSAHLAYSAPASGGAAATPPPAAAGGDGGAAWQRPEVMDRFLELGECLDRVVSGPSGQLFLLDTADTLEDVCAHVFFQWIWPRLSAIQDMLRQHEVRERVISEQERMDLSEWSLVIRKVLPLLLRILGQARSVDATTLGSAAFALAKLFHQENDSKSGQAELGLAIARMEGELAEASLLGPQPKWDQQVAAAVSFDPPGIRPPGFALFDGPGDPDLESGENVLVLKGIPRSLQDRLCLLTQLYTAWIDLSLKMHLKNVGSTIKRMRHPEEGPEDDGMLLGSDSTSGKVSLSNHEVAVLTQFGENPYLRSLFFVAVARRRPDAAGPALTKACREAETAATQEQQLWAFCEKELGRQQRILRNGEEFGSEFKGKNMRKGRKPRADPPLIFGRTPTSIRLRVPPLIGSGIPPLLPSAVELNPPEQAFEEEHQSEKIGARSPASALLSCAVFAKVAGTGTTVSELHRDFPGTGLRRFGHGFVEVSGLKPNTNYTFATMYFEGFEAPRPAASAISETSPPMGTYFPLPLALLRMEICKEALRAGEAGKAAWDRAWAPLLDSLCERTSPAEDFDSWGLRTIKLRLDVADRLPPAVMAAFADLVLMKNGQYGEKQSDAFPSTKPAQQAALRSANECLVAVDCARRAGAGQLTLQGVSLTLKLVERLLHYRTKPRVMLTLLTKCASALEAVNPADKELTWYAKARVMSTYLFHHIAVLCVQIRQKAVLAKQLDGDVPQRYGANSLADASAQAVANARLIDQALELALLGGACWPHAELKAKAALKDQPSDAIMRLLKDLSEREYVKVAKDAAQLAISEQQGRHPLSLVLMRSAVTRSWEKDEIRDPLALVLEKHPLTAALKQLLANSRKGFTDFGFMLRAVPLSRLKADMVEDADGDGAPVGSGTVAKDAAQTPGAGGAGQSPAAILAEHEDTAGLAQLELMRAGPLLQELCKTKFHWQDISRFKYFDLQQVSVPELSADGATLGAVENPAGTGESFQDTGTQSLPKTGQPDAWQVKDNENQENRTKAFGLLKQVLPMLVRSAVYASAKRADLQLQMALIAALNALLIVGPSPAECVPAGPQSNPKDTDPDRYVGAEEEPQANASEPEVNVWLDVALLAELAVQSLMRLKQELAPTPAPRPAAPKAKSKSGHAAASPRGAKPKPGPPPPSGEEEESEEQRAIRSAREMSEELGAADEELHELWFEKMPELDVTSIAKLVAFAVLCLYHMRRWDKAIQVCRSFNDITCFTFATTFLPLIIGAQAQVCNLSSRALANTERYLAEAKSTFEDNQKKLPRKLLRQLTLQGELSMPEKMFKIRTTYYEDMAKRQKRLHEAWELLQKALESSHALVARAVPAAVEQLRKSRILLAEFLQDRQNFSMRVARGLIGESERLGQERALRLASTALVSSYRKSVELLRKRQLADLVVQALHELGNLQWLEGDATGAQSSWSDAVDTAYQFVYAIKNWQKCIETAVSPPQTASRTEMMLLTVVILAKHARLTTPKDSAAHLNLALLASSIIEAILTTSLPHPSHRVQFSLDKYRLREIFFGLRESRMLLPSNSVHGGVDGTVFLGALAFFHNTLMVANYQPARSLPLCNLYNYVATDLCRNATLAVKGRLMMARALIRCRSFGSAWLVLHAISRGYDKPRSLLNGEVLDRLVAEIPEAAAGSPFLPYRANEDPFSDHNKQAIGQLLDFALAADPAAVEAGSAHNAHLFRFLQVEFLVCISSYGRMFAKVGDPEEAERVARLDKADTRLRALWKEVTGNDDDLVAVAGKAADPEHVAAPKNSLGEQESELCIDIKLLLSQMWESRGDLGKGAMEVLHAMRFVTMLAQTGTKSAQECNIGIGNNSGSLLRVHPGAKVWAALRRRMVHLLVMQGRLKAADAHIEQGLQECQDTNDDVTRVDLLAAKFRVSALQGRLLELRGERRMGAVPAALCCFDVAAKRLPVPPASAVLTKLVLSYLLEQNPSLAETSGEALSVQEKLSEVLASYGRNDDPNDSLILDAQGKVILSPIAKVIRSEDGKAQPKGHLAPAHLVAECLRELDALLALQAFELHPHNMNSVFNIGAAPGGAPAAERPPMLPPLKPAWRERPVSDAREPPNVYSELMPLRLHCELRLARLKLDAGDLEEAERLLRDAEARMARCVHLMPWLYVQFCVLKFQWRRLTYQLGVARSSPPPDAPNDLLYRDPKAFADGRCPPTDSPLFRTFMRRARTPPLTADVEWVPVALKRGEDDLDRFLHELFGVLRVAAKDGGHDYSQVLALLREALEELLRVRAGGRLDAKTQGTAYAFFLTLANVAEARKGLYFQSADPAPAAPVDPKAKPQDPKAAGPPPNVDAAALPARVALDIQNHLKRQGHDTKGDLAYSAGACQDAQKSLLFKTVTKYAFSLRRECDAFGSSYHAERLLCDQLHVALSLASEAYSKAKVIDEAQIAALASPPAVPTAGDTLVHWARPDTGEGPQPGGERIALFTFICPAGEAFGEGASQPMVARCNDVLLAELRRLADGFAKDLQHCRPATAVAADYVEQRLRSLAQVLRGALATAPSGDPGLDEALPVLLSSLAGQAAHAAGEEDHPPKLLDSDKCQELLRALLKLLDSNSGAARVAHTHLGLFLRATLRPLSCFRLAGRSTPSSPSPGSK